MNPVAPVTKADCMLHSRPVWSLARSPAGAAERSVRETMIRLTVRCKPGHNALEARGAAGVKIVFLQSGGFAGACRGLRLDAATLPAGERAELERLVAGCGLERSSEAATGPGRDQRQYDLAIERDGAVTRLSGDESSLPAEARPLVAYLAARAAPAGPDFSVPPATDHAAASDLAAGELWGRFDGRVVARWEADGRTMTLLAPFAYVDPRGVRWDAGPGLALDGASIPRAFWTLIGGPFAGEFREASVVHDAACLDRDRPWRAVHRMFYEACRCGGVGAVPAKTMYYAVFHFGPRWHVEERTTIVAGRPRLEPIIRDDTPAPPTADDVAAIERYFTTHDVAAEDIPTLEIIDPDG